MDDPPRLGEQAELTPAPGSESGWWRPALMIALLALSLNLAGNGRISLFDRDEPRYAGCTREMRERGDWLFPTFNGEPRYHKPILIYWLMWVGYELCGDNPFGARLASAVAGAASCLLVLSMGRRMIGPRAGFLAALMLATAPIMVVESKLATTDATLTLLLIACQFCLWELSQRDSRSLAAGFWIALGLATLTKGPVGLALIACAGVMSWWWGGPTVNWRRLHWRWGLPIFLLVAAPWYLAVGVMSRGEFYRFAIGSQVAQRVMTSMEQHGGFPGYYIVGTLVLFHPWSALLPGAVWQGWVNRKQHAELGFLLGWIIGPLILLECVRTKLIHYYLPAYPACALLVAWLVAGMLKGEIQPRRWRVLPLGLNLLTTVGFGIAGTLIAALYFCPEPLRVPCFMTGSVIALGTILGRRLLRLAETERALRLLAGTWALALFLLGFWVLPAGEPFRFSRVVGERLAQLSEERNAPPVLLSFQEPTLVYTMRRSAPMIRKWDQFYSELDRNGAIVTAISPLEIPEFARRDDHLQVDYHETIEGFNLTKGQSQLIRLATIRRRATASAPSDPSIRRSSVK